MAENNFSDFPKNGEIFHFRGPESELVTCAGHFSFGSVAVFRERWPYLGSGGLI